MDPQTARETLLRFRARLIDQNEALTEALGISLEEEGGDESSDQHIADVGAVTLNRQVDLTVQENVERLLNQVDRALEKIDEGTYGLCDRCGEPIEESRLQAAPEATLCLRHQKEWEQSEGA